MRRKCREIVKGSRNGFTSVELIIVIAALALLAGAAVVSIQISDQDRSTIAADQLIADIQYVQTRAMGTGNQQNIIFSTGTSSYSLREGVNLIEQKSLPDGVTIRSTNLSGNVLIFNTLGEPTFGTAGVASINIGKGSSPDRAVTILAVTGIVQ